MSESKNRRWILNSRPAGKLTGEEFCWNEAPIPEASDGQMLIRTLWLSVDPAQRIWMARDSYKPAVPLGEVMQSFAVGQGLGSRRPEIKAGEPGVVSGAAGATGSVAGQVAKIKGCHVIGTAGGRDKCDWLVNEAHFDAAIDYKSEDVGARLSKLCPNGIDVFFDNVGGDVLNEVLARINVNARIVLCGSISKSDAATPQPRPASDYKLL